MTVIDVGNVAVNRAAPGRAPEPSHCRVALSPQVNEPQYNIFNAIDVGFCVVEMIFDAAGYPVDYCYVRANPAFETHSGLHNVVGKRMRSLAPLHEPRWFERLGGVALTGESMRFVDEARGLGGRWLDVHAFRVETPRQRRVAILFSDITERRRIEAEMRERVRVLVELNQRKDAFLAVLSHELRNPLASLRNAAELLTLRRDRDPIELEAQDVINHQVAHLARIVDDLLDVSRISNGSFGLLTRTVDLREVVQRAMQTVRSEIDQKRQSLGESLPEKPVWIRGDAVRLEQVVVNILNNANKYTECGGLIEVTLRAEYEEVVLRISDNGAGITPELLPIIFDLFTQGEQPPERPHAGLGIGLALVQRLVDMHGGRVEAHSTPGRGSEFVVILPLCADLPQSARSGLPTAPTPAPGRPLKVLVVEDDPDVARSLGRLLQAAGHEILVAHDGTDAVQAAREFVPDIALLDIGLPRVDGFQVAKWVRAEPALIDLVLVALTGYACDSDRQRAAESGFDYYLVKPVSFVDIQNTLRSATTSGAGSES